MSGRESTNHPLIFSPAPGRDGATEAGEGWRDVNTDGGWAGRRGEIRLNRMKGHNAVME